MTVTLWNFENVWQASAVTFFILTRAFVQGRTGFLVNLQHWIPRNVFWGQSPLLLTPQKPATAYSLGHSDFTPYAVYIHPHDARSLIPSVSQHHAPCDRLSICKLAHAPPDETRRFFPNALDLYEIQLVIGGQFWIKNFYLSVYSIYYIPVELSIFWLNWKNLPDDDVEQRPKAT